MAASLNQSTNSPSVRMLTWMQVIARRLWRAPQTFQETFGVLEAMKDPNEQMTHRPGIPVFEKTFRNYFDIGQRMVLRGTTASRKEKAMYGAYQSMETPQPSPGRRRPVRLPSGSGACSTVQCSPPDNTYQYKMHTWYFIPPSSFPHGRTYCVQLGSSRLILARAR